MFGYTNAACTLKCNITCEYVCRLLNYMDARGYTMCLPRRDPDAGEAPRLNLNSATSNGLSTCCRRQGTKAPWRLDQNHAFDMLMLRFGKEDDGTMAFSAPDRTQAALTRRSLGRLRGVRSLGREHQTNGRGGGLRQTLDGAGDIGARFHIGARHQHHRVGPARQRLRRPSGQHRRRDNEEEIAAFPQVSDQLRELRRCNYLLDVCARLRGCKQQRARFGVSYERAA